MDIPAVDVYTSVEAAAVLGRTSSTIHRWVEAGKLVPVRTLPGYNGRVLFLASDVDTLAERLAAAKAARVSHRRRTPLVDTQPIGIVA